MAFRRMPLAFGQGEQGTKIQHELTVLTGQRVANFGKNGPIKLFQRWVHITQIKRRDLINVVV